MTWWKLFQRSRKPEPFPCMRFRAFARAGGFPTTSRRASRFDRRVHRSGREFPIPTEIAAVARPGNNAVARPVEAETRPVPQRAKERVLLISASDAIRDL